MQKFKYKGRLLAAATKAQAVRKILASCGTGRRATAIAGDDWIAYYFCVDSKGHQFAVMPHLKRRVGNGSKVGEGWSVNCDSTAGAGLYSWDFIKGCEPIVSPESSDIYAKVSRGEDRRVVVLTKNEAEDVVSSSDGLAELKAIVADKPEKATASARRIRSRRAHASYSDCASYKMYSLLRNMDGRYNNAPEVIDELIQYKNRLEGRRGKRFFPSNGEPFIKAVEELCEDIEYYNNQFSDTPNWNWGNNYRAGESTSDVLDTIRTFELDNPDANGGRYEYIVRRAKELGNEYCRMPDNDSDKVSADFISWALSEDRLEEMYEWYYEKRTGKDNYNVEGVISTLARDYYEASGIQVPYSDIETAINHYGAYNFVTEEDEDEVTSSARRIRSRKATAGRFVWADVGYYTKLDSGKNSGKTEYFGGHTSNGYVFVDTKAYEKGDGVCYIPEFEFHGEGSVIPKPEDVYTKDDLVSEAKSVVLEETELTGDDAVVAAGQLADAFMDFAVSEGWCYPSTWMSEAVESMDFDGIQATASARRVRAGYEGGRFRAEKRKAADGKQWWCVWDTKNRCWSTLTCFGKYRTKEDCESAIESVDDDGMPRVRYEHGKRVK